MPDKQERTIQQVQYARGIPNGHIPIGSFVQDFDNAEACGVVVAHVFTEQTMIGKDGYLIVSQNGDVWFRNAEELVFIRPEDLPQVTIIDRNGTKAIGAGEGLASAHHVTGIDESLPPIPDVSLSIMRAADDVLLAIKSVARLYEDSISQYVLCDNDEDDVYDLLGKLGNIHCRLNEIMVISIRGEMSRA